MQTSSSSANLLSSGGGGAPATRPPSQSFVAAQSSSSSMPSPLHNAVSVSSSSPSPLISSSSLTAAATPLGLLRRLGTDFRLAYGLTRGLPHEANAEAAAAIVQLVQAAGRQQQPQQHGGGGGATGASSAANAISSSTAANAAAAAAHALLLGNDLYYGDNGSTPLTIISHFVQLMLTMELDAHLAKERGEKGGAGAGAGHNGKRAATTAPVTVFGFMRGNTVPSLAMDGLLNALPPAAVTVPIVATLGVRGGGNSNNTNNTIHNNALATPQKRSHNGSAFADAAPYSPPSGTLSALAGGGHATSNNRGESVEGTYEEGLMPTSLDGVALVEACAAVGGGGGDDSVVVVGEGSASRPTSPTTLSGAASPQTLRQRETPPPLSGVGLGGALNRQPSYSSSAVMGSPANGGGGLGGLGVEGLMALSLVAKNDAEELSVEDVTKGGEQLLTRLTALLSAMKGSVGAWPLWLVRSLACMCRRIDAAVGEMNAHLPSPQQSSSAAVAAAAASEHSHIFLNTVVLLRYIAPRILRLAEDKLQQREVAGVFARALQKVANGQPCFPMVYACSSPTSGEAADRLDAHMEGLNAAIKALNARILSEVGPQVRGFYAVLLAAAEGGPASSANGGVGGGGGSSPGSAPRSPTNQSFPAAGVTRTASVPSSPQPPGGLPAPPPPPTSSPLNGSVVGANVNPSSFASSVGGGGPPSAPLPSSLNTIGAADRLMRLLLLRHMPRLVDVMSGISPLTSSTHAAKVLEACAFHAMRSEGPLIGGVNGSGGGGGRPMSIAAPPLPSLPPAAVTATPAPPCSPHETLWEALVRHGNACMQRPVMSSHPHQFVTMAGPCAAAASKETKESGGFGCCGTSAGNDTLGDSDSAMGCRFPSVPTAAVLFIHGDVLLMSEQTVLRDPLRSRAVLARSLPMYQRAGGGSGGGAGSGGSGAEDGGGGSANPNTLLLGSGGTAASIATTPLDGDLIAHIAMHIDLLLSNSQCSAITVVHFSAAGDMPSTSSEGSGQQQSSSAASSVIGAEPSVFNHQWVKSLFTSGPDSPFPQRVLQRVDRVVLCRAPATSLKDKVRSVGAKFLSSVVGLGGGGSNQNAAEDGPSYASSAIGSSAAPRVEYIEDPCALIESLGLYPSSLRACALAVDTALSVQAAAQQRSTSGGAGSSNSNINKKYLAAKVPSLFAPCPPSLSYGAAPLCGGDSPAATGGSIACMVATRQLLCHLFDVTTRLNSLGLTHNLNTVYREDSLEWFKRMGEYGRKGAEGAAGLMAGTGLMPSLTTPLSGAPWGFLDYTAAAHHHQNGGGQAASSSSGGGGGGAAAADPKASALLVLKQSQRVHFTNVLTCSYMTMTMGGGGGSGSTPTPQHCAWPCPSLRTVPMRPLWRIVMGLAWSQLLSSKSSSSSASPLSFADAIMPSQRSLHAVFGVNSTTNAAAAACGGPPIIGADGPDGGLLPSSGDGGDDAVHAIILNLTTWLGGADDGADGNDALEKRFLLTALCGYVTELARLNESVGISSGGGGAAAPSSTSPTPTSAVVSPAAIASFEAARGALEALAEEGASPLSLLPSGDGSGAAQQQQSAMGAVDLILGSGVLLPLQHRRFSGVALPLLFISGAPMSLLALMLQA